ncbi:MAG: hypothetical protein MUP45_02655 [Candidatus Marinimicrobia bacterium]|nr:hypothetical protein [Candidatus Neomarinimicrobiota bacterium]
MRKIAIVFLALIPILLLSNSLIWGQETSEELVGARVYINAGPVFSPNTVTLNLPYSDQTNNVKITNSTASTDTIQNTQAPVGATTFPDVIIAPNQDRSYLFSCPTASGTWTFKIKNTSVTLTVIVNCGPDHPSPTLTQWGMIILIALIIVTGVYLWLRKKPVTA